MEIRARVLERVCNLYYLGAPNTFWHFLDKNALFAIRESLWVRIQTNTFWEEISRVR